MSNVTWPRAFGWYAVGAASTVFGVSLLAQIGRYAPGPLPQVAWLMAPAAVVGLAVGARRLPRGLRWALVAGAVTPILLAAAAIAYLAYAFAQSGFTF